VDVLDEVAAVVPVRSDRPSVVAVTGAVAVGKSTVAAQLADALAPRRVAIVSTDGFLMTNADLVARDILLRKGFPESYDVGALRAFLADVTAGRRAEAPVYSHLTYDRVPGARQIVQTSDVVVVEGLHLLHDDLAPLRSFFDLSVFLDADDADLERWYIARFRQLVLRARDEPDAFKFFRSLTPDAVEDAARMTWQAVNAPNVSECIRPTRSRADIVLEKASDHTLRRIVARR